MDEPSIQLNLELKDATHRLLAQRRPILHHLNADTSWLLQLPRPAHSIPRSGRYWFNILLDPWLSGSQSDVASWFSQQWHAITPAVSSIQQVEELAYEIEILSGADPSKLNDSLSTTNGTSNTPSKPADHPLIDAIAISHEFTDHCHQETLLKASPTIPIFATTKAAQLISSWKHFHTVLEPPTFSPHNPDWKALSLPPLPDWVTLAQLRNEGDFLYYHSALLIAFDTPDHDPPPGRRKWSARYSSGLPPDPPPESPAEAIIYTPHGISAPALHPITTATPPLATLALLHGLHDVAISSQQLNMGAHNGLKAQRLLKAKYWLGTHDEVKRAGGFVRWFLRRRIVSLGEALGVEMVERAGEERKGDVSGVGDDCGDERMEQGEEKKEVRFDDPQYLDLGNGESAVLV